MRRQTHESLLSNREVALGLVSVLPLMLDMPFPQSLPIERAIGARLHAVVSRSQPSVVTFGYVTESALRTSSRLLRYLVRVLVGLP